MITELPEKWNDLIYKLNDAGLTMEEGRDWILEILNDEVLSEETHDVYAWTRDHNGTERPVFNCTMNTIEHNFEQLLGDPGDDIDLTLPFNAEVIYFFGEKVSE